MIFYCPICKKLEMDFKMNSSTPHVGNIRDGYGHPLYHMKCECGNYLSAGIHFTKDEVEKDLGLLDYIKKVITGYNKNGCFYMAGYYEYAEDRINQIEQRNKEILEERAKVSTMTDLEKEEYFKRKYENLIGSSDNNSLQ